MRSPVNEARVSSPYGNRILKRKKQFHDGIDFVSNSDDCRVYAIADGVVVFDKDDYDEAVRWTDNKHSGGNMIIIDHVIDGVHYYARYLHLGENTVSKHQEVREGDVVGEYADVGLSYGAHLHFDMYSWLWKKINPTPVIAEVLPV